MKFSSLKEFEKDLKRLKKKFPSLDEDMEVLKTYGIELFHRKTCSIDVVRIQGCLNDTFVIYKVRTIACKSLSKRGKRSGLRLIYAYDEKNDEAIFIELYFKGEKDNEDKRRVKAFIESFV